MESDKVLLLARAQFPICKYKWMPGQDSKSSHSQAPSLKNLLFDKLVTEIWRSVWSNPREPSVLVGPRLRGVLGCGIAIFNAKTMIVSGKLDGCSPYKRVAPKRRQRE